MPTIDVNIEQKINALMMSEANSESTKDAVNFAVGGIQDHIDVTQLPLELHRIMNSWIRTDSWYYTGLRTDSCLFEHGVSKFELCLRRIVARKMKKLVFERLTKYIIQIGVFYQMPDELDLYYATRDVSYELSDGWSTMGTDLADEALRWTKKHHEHVTDNDSEKFQWIHPDTGEECYHLPHLPKSDEHYDKPEEHDVEHVLSSLEILPSNFQHKPDWTCPICLEVGEGTTCVRTKCKHVFHEQCFKDCNRAYLKQEENDGKTSCPCPICRRDVIN